MKGRRPQLAQIRMATVNSLTRALRSLSQATSSRPGWCCRDGGTGAERGAALGQGRIEGEPVRGL